MLRSLLVSLAATLLASGAQAGVESEAVIAETARDLTAGVVDIETLDSLIDTETIAKFTLGRYLTTLPDTDIAAFTAAFDRFIVSTLNTEAGRLAGAEIEIVGSVDRTPRDSIVTTRVTLPGQTPETVRWRVIERDGSWKVVDMQAFGLWLAIEQRAQIAAILDRRGARIEDVIAQLGTAQTYAETETDQPEWK